MHHVRCDGCRQIGFFRRTGQYCRQFEFFANRIGDLGEALWGSAFVAAACARMDAEIAARHKIGSDAGMNEFIDIVPVERKFEMRAVRRCPEEVHELLQVQWLRFAVGVSDEMPASVAKRQCSGEPGNGFRGEPVHDTVADAAVTMQLQREVEACACIVS